MSLPSSRTLLVKVPALAAAEADGAAADAQVVEAVAVQQTVISESSVEEVLQVTVVDTEDLQLQVVDTVADSEGLLLLLRMVGLHLMVAVDMVVDPTETHQVVAAANLGGKLHSTSLQILLLFDSTDRSGVRRHGYRQLHLWIRTFLSTSYFR